MEGWLRSLLEWLSEAPAAAVYLVVGFAAVLENLVPPVPADVTVAVGGVLAGQGDVSPWILFVLVWVGNVFGALLVYLLGRRYGAALFAGRWGRMILRPQQLEQLGTLYARRGASIIFVSRFLPMFRAVVPAFAGIARMDFWRTAIPIATASGLWYGLIVYLGAAAGRNLEEILGMLSSAGRWFGLVAVVVAVALGWWWWRSRQAGGKR